MNCEASRLPDAAAAMVAQRDLCGRSRLYQICAAIARPSSRGRRASAEVGRARRARIGQHALDRRDDGVGRRPCSPGSRASARPTRSARSDWRCPCPRCRAPSRAPARRATGTCARDSGWPTARCRSCRTRRGPGRTGCRRTGWSATTTSKRSGRCTKCAERMSMWYWSVRHVRIVRGHRAEALVPVRHRDRDAVRLGRRREVLRGPRRARGRTRSA